MRYALNNTIRNAGRVVLGSGYATDQPRIIGSGRIENAGLVQVVREAPGPGRALVGVPIVVGGGGRLAVDPDARLAFTGGGLTLAGELAFGTGATLEHLTGARMTLQAGNSVTGGGSLSFLGSGALRLEADAIMNQALNLGGSFLADGSGRLILATNQTLSGTFQVPLELGSGTHVAVQSGTTLNGEVTVEPGAMLELNSGQPNLNLNQRLLNHGTVRVWSRAGADVDRIRGSGWVDNAGRFEVTAWTSNSPGAAVIRVPVRVEAAGKVVLGENALMNSAAGGVTNAGALQLDSGAQLAFLGDSPLTLEAGNTLPGEGRVQFFQNSKLWVLGDASAEWQLELNTNGIASGAAALTLAGRQTLTGTYECPVNIPPEAWAEVHNAIFRTNILVCSNGVLNVPGNYALRLDQVLTNYGMLQMTSRGAASAVNTARSGCIVNHRLLQVIAEGSGGQVASVSLPLFVTPPGRLLIRTNATLALTDGGQMAVSGKVEVEKDGLLRMDPGTFPRDFMLFAGAEILGAGEVRLSGFHRLLVLGDTLLSGGQLTLTGNTRAGGHGRLLIGRDALLVVDHSLNLPGSLTVEGDLQVLGTNTELTINGSLVLAEDGVIENPGTIKAGSYINLGGTIIGNPPKLLDARPAPSDNWIRISQIRPEMERSAGTGTALRPVATGTVLSWLALPGTQFLIETSKDLRVWTAVEASILEIAPGYYQGRVAGFPAGESFFRVRTQTAK